MSEEAPEEMVVWTVGLWMSLSFMLGTAATYANHPKIALTLLAIGLLAFTYYFTFGFTEYIAESGDSTPRTEASDSR